jgi:putative FmdB family regulatory protein
MPTYEYRCKSCGHEMEVQQAFSDDPLETCPECQGPLRKVYGNVGIAFKGSGFYKNDARSGSSGSTTSTSGASTSSSGSDAGSSSGEKATAAAAPSGD